MVPVVSPIEDLLNAQGHKADDGNEKKHNNRQDVVANTGLNKNIPCEKSGSECPEQV